VDDQLFESLPTSSHPFEFSAALEMNCSIVRRKVTTPCAKTKKKKDEKQEAGLG